MKWPAVLKCSPCERDRLPFPFGEGGTKGDGWGLSEVDKTLIYYKYFGILPKDEDFDLKSRNYFRKQNKAIERFDNALKSKGYDEEWFFKKYLKISFIAGIYQKMILEEGKKHSLD